MRSSHVTVLWLAKRAPSASILAQAARSGATVACPPRTVTRAATERGLRDGAVLAVVDGEEEADELLALGVDEAINPEGAVLDVFSRAIERARVRAMGRELRELRVVDMLRADATLGIELLASSLGRELLAPLANATIHADGLLEKIALDVAEDEAARTKAEALVAVLRHASAVTAKMRSLVDVRSEDEVTDLTHEIAELADALGGGVRRAGRFDVELTAEICLVTIPRWHVVDTVTALLGNAVAAISRRADMGGSVRVALRLVEDSAVIEVSDDGPGMVPEVRERALEPFFKSEAEEGLGLNLAVARARVRRVGGDLEIASSVAEGTTIRVWLPLALDAARVLSP
jgi:signal transduction histidine kinase